MTRTLEHRGRWWRGSGVGVAQGQNSSSLPERSKHRPEAWGRGGGDVGSRREAEGSHCHFLPENIVNCNLVKHNVRFSMNCFEDKIRTKRKDTDAGRQ